MSGSSGVMQVFVTVLLVGNLLALAAGLALIAAPRRVVSLLGMRTKPVTGRRLTKALDKSRDADKTLLRYPNVLGVALVAGGAFVLIKWTLFVGSLSVAQGGEMLTGLFPDVRWPAAMWESVWVTLLAVVLLGALLAIAVGALAFVSAQKLKRISVLANQWVSTRKASKKVAQPHFGLDRLVAARPQAWGAIISVLSLYTLAMVFWFGRSVFF